MLLAIELWRDAKCLYEYLCNVCRYSSCIWNSFDVFSHFNQCLSSSDMPPGTSTNCLYPWSNHESTCQSALSSTISIGQRVPDRAQIAASQISVIPSLLDNFNKSSWQSAPTWYPKIFFTVISQTVIICHMHNNSSTTTQSLKSIGSSSLDILCGNDLLDVNWCLYHVSF